jgi:hypothetical protein
MNKPFSIGSAALLLAASLAQAADMTTSAASGAANPLTAPWTGPYGGVPPWDKVRVDLLKPALETAMADQLAAVDRIAKNPATPTFENTIVELERSSRMLDRVSTLEGVYESTMSDDAMQAVERDMAPKLAEFGDKITQNEKLFAASRPFTTRGKSGLTPGSGGWRGCITQLTFARARSSMRRRRSRCRTSTSSSPRCIRASGRTC